MVNNKSLTPYRGWIFYTPLKKSISRDLMKPKRIISFINILRYLLFKINTPTRGYYISNDWGRI